MSSPAYLPLFGSDYLADTSHLTTEEHGAYLLLLMAAWRQEDCTLPHDDKKLARIVGLTTRKWAAIKATIMEFWTVENGRIFQSRLRKERGYVLDRSRKQAQNASVKWDGKRGATPRENAKKRSQRLSEAREKGRHTADQWARLVAFLGNKCVICESDGPLVKDHITPIYLGGSDGIENLQPLCNSCNSSKSSDCTDHRLKYCFDLIERLPDVCGTHTPQPQPQEEVKEERKEEGACAPRQPDDPGRYAFCGRVIRLDRDGYRKWEKAFDRLDLPAMLQSRDDWYSSQPDDVRKKWFIPTSNWLASRQQEAKRVVLADEQYVGFGGPC